MLDSIPKISAIIPIRNRSSARLENCLRALRWQTLPNDDYEIIVSDFGSNREQEEALIEMAERHQARVVRTDTEEIWNRSRALNYGIRAARGHFIFCTDADMIFAPNFLSTLLAVQAKHGEKALAVCHCRDLPESVPEQPWTLDDYPALLAQAPFREKLGTGACQMALRSRFEELRGYDEGYKFWGMEDNDMKFRAIRSGLELVWIHEQTSMLHQWHPSDRGAKPFRKFINDARFHISKYRLKKNPEMWGGQP